MDDVQLACSVPSPAMHLSGLEGVVEESGPHWGTTVVIAFTCWGTKAQARGLRSQPPSSRAARAEWVHVVQRCGVGPGPARWETPACRPGLGPWESSRWSSGYLSWGPKPYTVTSGSCHMDTLLPNSTCRAEP